MGGSLTENAVRRVGKSVTMITTNFDKETIRTSAHSECSDTKDIQRVILTLQEYKAFTIIQGRSHTRFPGMLSTQIRCYAGYAKNTNSNFQALSYRMEAHQKMNYRAYFSNTRSLYIQLTHVHFSTQHKQRIKFWQ